MIKLTCTQFADPLYCLPPVPQGRYIFKLLAVDVRPDAMPAMGLPPTPDARIYLEVGLGMSSFLRPQNNLQNNACVNVSFNLFLLYLPGGGPWSIQ